MKTTKLTRTLLTGMMTCTMALTTMSVTTLTNPTVTHAAVTKDSTTDFKLYLHKFKTLTGAAIENTGDEIPGLTHERLNGVEFDVYNVTKLFHDIKADKGYTNQQTAAYLSDNWTLDQADIDFDKSEAVWAHNITTRYDPDKNQDGIASTSLPKTTKVGEGNPYSIYMFVETDGPDDVIKSRPFILGMNKDLAAKGTVDLYAKNYGAQKDLMVDENSSETLDDGYYSYEAGKILTYTSSSPVPADIVDATQLYTMLHFYDEMTAVGTDFVDIKEIYVGEGASKTDVKAEFLHFAALISSNDKSAWAGLNRTYAGFDLKLDISQAKIDSLSPAEQTRLNNLITTIAGQKLSFKYQMQINDQAIPYQEIGNRFVGKLTNKHGEATLSDDSSKVETGGHEFIKIDSDTDEGLVGAKFIIQNADEQFAKLKKSDGTELTSTTGQYAAGQVEWTDDIDEATEIESGADGFLLVSGLKPGDYTLIETEAPAGYEIRTKNTPFTVNSAVDGLNTPTPITIENDPKDGFHLPITGGIGIVSFLAIGAAAMGGAVYYKKKKA